MLITENITKSFGGIKAVDACSIEVQKGSITGLIGPNGSGKTTLFNIITGFYQPDAGSIRFNQQPIQGLKPSRICHKGIGRTFQITRLFWKMTVLENLIVAQHNVLQGASMFSLGGLFKLATYRHAETAALEKAMHWLDRLGLTEFADTAAGALPYGTQRRIEIARALCVEPVLLCLDEPAAGLNPRESAALNDLLIHLSRDEGVAVLLIEHDMSVVMQVSDHIVVLNYGRKIAEGTPTVIQNDPHVIKAYLGEDETVEPLAGAAA